MKEETLKNYFQNTVSITELSEELTNLIKIKENTRYRIIQYKSIGREFNIEKRHLLKLCTASIEKKIELNDLTKIAFVLRASDYFIWDSSSEDGKIVNQVISNWESPEIYGPLTSEYIQYCSYYLETGEHR